MDKHLKDSAHILTPIAILIGSLIIAGSILAAGASHRNIAPATQQSMSVDQHAAASLSTLDSSKVNSKGRAYIGEADAPLVIAYWYDYQCPFCRQNEETVMADLIRDYIDTGKARIVFKNLQFLGPDSKTLGVVAGAVWEVAPDKYYAWHKAIFDNQGPENSGWATKEKVLSISSSVLGTEASTRMMQLIEENADRYQEAIDADEAEASAFGVTSTPSFVIGSQLLTGAKPYAEIKAMIDAELKRI